MTCSPITTTGRITAGGQEKKRSCERKVDAIAPGEYSNIVQFVLSTDTNHFQLNAIIRTELRWVRIGCTSRPTGTNGSHQQHRRL